MVVRANRYLWKPSGAGRTKWETQTEARLALSAPTHSDRIIPAHFVNGTAGTHVLPTRFLDLVDKFIHRSNQLADDGRAGEVSAPILFAAGRYNAFNFVSTDGIDEARPQAEGIYVSEYRKAFVSNLEGAVGPVVRSQE